jgi:hypothetical protein
MVLQQDGGNIQFTESLTLRAGLRLVGHKQQRRINELRRRNV